MNDPYDSPTTGHIIRDAGAGKRHAQMGLRWKDVRRDPIVQATPEISGPDVAVQFVQSAKRAERPGLATRVAGGIVGAVIAREIYRRTHR